VYKVCDTVLRMFSQAHRRGLYQHLDRGIEGKVLKIHITGVREPCMVCENDEVDFENMKNAIFASTVWKMQGDGVVGKCLLEVREVV
jgi:hypothetical protein